MYWKKRPANGSTRPRKVGGGYSLVTPAGFRYTIDANADSVTVAIRRQPDEEGSARRYLLREQPERPASRVFQFPVEIDTDEIRATLQAGILRIHVPKAAASRPRVIKVNQAA